MREVKAHARVAACFGLLGLAALHGSARGAIGGPEPIAADGRYRVFATTDEVTDLDVLAWLAVADDAFTERFEVPTVGSGERDVWLAGAGFLPRGECEHDFDAHVARGAAAFYARSCGNVHVQRTALPTELVRVLLHEAIHQRVAFDGWPALDGPGAWLTEGLGVWAEHLDASGVLDLRRSQRLAEARTLYRAGLLAPLPDYLDFDAQELAALGQELVTYAWNGRVFQRRVAVHHSQAATVIGFLESRHHDAFAALVRGGLEHGLSHHRLLEQLGLTPDELLSQYERWMRGIQIQGVDR